jgi:uncharacterized protein
VKYLILLLAILGLVWWLRRPKSMSSTQAEKRNTADGPQEMTRCLDCGLHLPRLDAVAGAQGLYCSEAHRQRHEG